MKISKYMGCDIKDWYIASGKINGRYYIGYGRTHYEAILDAFKN